MDDHTGWEGGDERPAVRSRQRVLLIIAGAAVAVVAVAALVGAWRGDTASGAGDRLRVGDEPTQSGGWVALEDDTGASPLVAGETLRIVDVDAGTDAEPTRIEQVDLGGGSVVGPVDVPPGQAPLAGQGDWVLLGGPAGLRWWDPATGWTSDIAGAQVLDVGDATTVVCDASCRTVDILGPNGRRTGRARTAEPVVAAVLSPDERRVALLTGRDVATGTLLMVDRDAEQLETLANGFAPPRSSPAPAWEVAGTRLFLPTADGRLAVVDAASGRVAVSDADVGDATAFVALATAP